MAARICTLTTFFLLIFVSCSHGDVSVIYSSMGKEHFSVSIADNWRVNVGSDSDLSRIAGEDTAPSRIISAMPNKGVPLWFAIWVPDDLERIEDAEGYMENLGLGLLSDITVSNRSFSSQADLKAYRVSGTGDKNGQMMDFKSVFIQLADNSVAVVLYIGPEESTTRYSEDLLRMVHSIRPMEPSGK